MIKEIFNKLFLVKEIRSQEGELHFLRWRFFSCPWLRVYLHKICLPDYDVDKHTHPWNFISLILRGGYYEEWCDAPDFKLTKASYHARWSLVKRGRHDSHQITRIYSPVWTLVLSYGSYQDWGYMTEKGFVNHQVYRKLKNRLV